MPGWTCRLAVVLVSLPGPARAEDFFDDRVEPILRARCLSCHDNALRAGGVSFLDREGLLKQGRRGAPIVPHKPDQSIVIQAVRQDGDLKMPPGAKLSPEDIATLTEWIERGAVWGAKLRASEKVDQQLPFETWKFNRIDKVGDHPATMLGHPRVVDKTVEFNGIDDALFVDIDPLAGERSFTWEVAFRPEAGGAAEQTLFHLSSGLRISIRSTEGRWRIGTSSHAFGRWYHLAVVYDGRILRSYVNGDLEESSDLKFASQDHGRTSIGARIDRSQHFKGAIRWARITRGLLSPAQFIDIATQ
jgi:concanavalin A-like lectin/glucanase superfamily protein/cytochrome c